MRAVSLPLLPPTATNGVPDAPTQTMAGDGASVVGGAIEVGVAVAGAAVAATVVGGAGDVAAAVLGATSELGATPDRELASAVASLPAVSRSGAGSAELARPDV